MTRGSGFGVRRLAIVQVKPTNAQKTRHFESRHHMLFFILIIPFRFIGTRRIGPNRYDRPVIAIVVIPLFRAHRSHAVTNVR